MGAEDHFLTVDGSTVRLRRVDTVRLVSPARNQHPAVVAARLARSSRIAIDPAYPADMLVVRGEAQKLQQISSYPDVRHTRAAFQDPAGHLLVLTNDILVGFDASASAADRERLVQQAGGRVVDRKNRYWKVRIDDTADDAPLVLSNQLTQEDMVRYAEPDALQALWFQQQPQDEPRFADQWTLRNTGQNGGTQGADVDALGAWAITTGAASVRVVVHDTGVDITHPDLAANVGAGWDFDNNDNDATPDTGAGHGTCCAGIVAAAANGLGVVGIAPHCQIIPLRATGAHTDSVWADTFDWAAQRAQFISCSWLLTPNNTVSDAIRDAVNHGVTVFCAAGNGGVDWIGYPASMAETIAVGASTNQDVRPSYSQYGTGLDIVAPSNGGTLGVVTTDIQGPGGYNTAASPQGDYFPNFGGTSAATPLAAGIAALMDSVLMRVDATLTPDRIRAILHQTADKIDSANASYDANGWSRQYGYGRVNAARAVAAAAELVGELQLATTTRDGGLWHTIRHADGSWQQFGDVKGQAGDRGQVVEVDCGYVGGELQLAVATGDGGLWHTIRHADGSWQQFGDAKGQAGDPGPIRTVSTAGTSIGFHLIRFVIGTGDDDLRGDSTATADVFLKNGGQFTVTLKAKDAPSWQNGSIHGPLDFPIPSTVTLPTSTEGLSGVRINLIQGGSFPETEDNWDISFLQVSLFNSDSEQVCQLNPVGGLRLQDNSTGLVRLSGSPGSSGVGPSSPVYATGPHS